MNVRAHYGLHRMINFSRSSTHTHRPATGLIHVHVINLIRIFQNVGRPGK
jgi:hypothetical protein